MSKFLLGACGRVVAVGALIVFMVGCGKDHGVKLYPVKGAVYINGAPAKDVNVMFTRTIPLEGFSTPISPSAVTEDDGSFRLMSFDPDDGAPEGDYQVTIIYPMSRFNKNLSGIDRLKGKFANPKTSNVTAKVEPKINNLPTFDLKAEVMPPAPTQTSGAQAKYKKNRDK